MRTHVDDVVRSGGEGTPRRYCVLTNATTSLAPVAAQSTPA
jgi:hypothetical protein